MGLRTVTYDAPTSPQLGLVSVDLTGAGTAASTLSLTNSASNNLTAGGIFVGGYSGSAATAGRGRFTQSVGTVTLAGGADFLLGYGVSSMGTYTQTGGAMSASQSEFIGYQGVGTYTQSGGTNTINNNSVGSLSVAGKAGSTGNYNLSGTGVLSVNVNENIGDTGAGTFTQAGGTNTIGVNPSTSVPYDMNLGLNSGSTGTYSISAGSATAPGFVYVGGPGTGSGGGTGTLNISGTGTMTVGTELEVLGASSAVNLSGGTLNSTSLNFNRALFHWTGGTLNLTTNVVLTNNSNGASVNHIASSLGPTLTLGAGQTLKTTGSESIGSSSGGYTLTLNTGSANSVATTLVISRTGASSKTRERSPPTRRRWATTRFPVRVTNKTAARIRSRRRCRSASERPARMGFTLCLARVRCPPPRSNSVC